LAGGTGADGTTGVGVIGTATGVGTLEAWAREVGTMWTGTTGVGAIVCVAIAGACCGELSIKGGDFIGSDTLITWGYGGGALSAELGGMLSRSDMRVNGSVSSMLVWVDWWVDLVGIGVY
jgi:hypothetical protein